MVIYSVVNGYKHAAAVENICNIRTIEHSTVIDYVCSRKFSNYLMIIGYIGN